MLKNTAINGSVQDLCFLFQIMVPVRPYLLDTFLPPNMVVGMLGTHEKFTQRSPKHLSLKGSLHVAQRGVV